MLTVKAHQTTEEGTTSGFSVYATDAVRHLATGEIKELRFHTALCGEVRIPLTGATDVFVENQEGRTVQVFRSPRDPDSDE